MSKIILKGKKTFKKENTLEKHFCLIQATVFISLHQTFNAMPRQKLSK